MTANLTAPEFTDEAAAIAHLEQSRWPDQVSCPYCGSLNVHRMAGQTQAGYFQCNDCRDKFTCRTGTVMERSHIPVHKWLLAIHLMASSKKGMSAHQLHRMLGVTYKSAWFLAHRVREAMIETNPSPLGGEGKSVQADETYIGNSSKRAKGYKKGMRHKEQIVALVEPKGKARVVHVKTATAEKVREILVTNASRKSELHTDESKLYVNVGKEFAAHKTVEHGFNQHGYYVGKDGQTTNAAENFFGIFKRGMIGTYHKCEAQHLQRYLAERGPRTREASGHRPGPIARAPPSMAGRGRMNGGETCRDEGVPMAPRSGPGSTVLRTEIATVERREASALRYWARHASSACRWRKLRTLVCAACDMMDAPPGAPPPLF